MRTDRLPRPRALAALVLALLTGGPLLAASGGAAGPAAAAEPPPDLSVSPEAYVGGQSLTWTGSVGTEGRRRLVLQSNMGTVTGNHWVTVPGFTDRTRADGSFTFTYPAPSMFNIRYRVKAGRHVTPAQVFNAKTQDLTIRVTGQRENNTAEPGRVGVDRPFGITVDTTPDNIYRSPESHGLPAFPGRGLTLQRREGDSWRTVATGTVAADGSGHFTGLRAPAGIAVYRVREEDYLTHGNRIGWIASFPLYVLVGPDAERDYTTRYGSNRPSASTTPPTGRLGAQPPTASQRYSWFPSRFDFAWEHGESLSSPPARGTRTRGGWSERSTGSGRVAKYNGGLAIDSKRYNGAGAGDFGTTVATLHGNAMRRGRWEASLRIRNAFERGGRPYEVLAELVPARAKDRDCGAHDLTIASISPFSTRVDFGVRSPGHEWSGTTLADHTPLANAYNVAVEVARDHLTWFLDGSPVGSVTSRRAVPGVPLTMRLSLRGHDDDEMDQTGVISDWQRGFPLTTGHPTLSPERLTRSAAAPASCTAD